MFLDAREVPGDTLLEADLCIIGGGTAGIAIARSLLGLPVRVLLLESGGLERDPATQSLYEGENAGLPYEPAHCGRSRFFGGSSNCWGGWCRPLEPLDFEARDWVPNSGWPFGRATLDPYYKRAHEVLQLGPLDYDAASWQAAIGRPDAQLLPLPGTGMVNKILQFSPPTRLGQVYRAELAAAANVRVLLHANATQLIPDPLISEIRRLRVQTLAGGRFAVTARLFVLATGGIENARLLLASNEVVPAGLGNGHDLVGRYFMDHARIRSGVLTWRDPRRFAAFYDPRMNYHSQELRAHGVSVAAHLAPSEALQRRDRLLNGRTAVLSVMLGEESAGFHRVKALYQEARRNTHRVRPSAGDLATILRDLPAVATAGLGHVLRARPLIRLHRIEDVVEPVPNPDSRVTLSADRDRLGMNKIRIDWRLSAVERRSIARTRAVLARELAETGLGRLDLTEPAEAEGWPRDLLGCWHHIGTTRMHEDPRRGVVDPAGRVHGLANLYVAGSSVFPTAGADTPTITIVALALRLGDALRRALEPRVVTIRPAAAPEAAVA